MRAWVMVNARSVSLEVCKDVKEKISKGIVRCLPVWGFYDEVLEVHIDSVNRVYDEVISELDELTTNILMLPSVSASTTYLSVSEKTKAEAKGEPFAYILMDVMPEALSRVRDTLFEINEVQKADIVLGPFDIIVELAVKSLDELESIMYSKIFGQSEILRTATLIVLPHRGAPQ